MAIPQEEQLNPDRIKRLHGIYNTLKSKGDDEGLAEFTEYMKSKDSIIGFDREGNPILEAKKGGAVRMQAGGTTQDKVQEEMIQQAGLDTTTAPALPTGTQVTSTPLAIGTGEIATQPTIGTTPTTTTTEASTTSLDVTVPQSPNCRNGGIGFTSYYWKHTRSSITASTGSSSPRNCRPKSYC